MDVNVITNPKFRTPLRQHLRSRHSGPDPRRLIARPPVSVPGGLGQVRLDATGHLVHGRADDGRAEYRARAPAGQFASVFVDRSAFLEPRAAQRLPNRVLQRAVEATAREAVREEHERPEEEADDDTVNYGGENLGAGWRGW
ncbi:MAG: hypothetical protein VYE81_03705 [Planctomycetota bacterium]|nr:hypothetical protein [Planctomycetota bacterium]